MTRLRRRTTSGDTKRYILKDGKRYGHILDARTGWPIEGAPHSVTVAADTCIEAGMLTTIAMLHGPEAIEFLPAQEVRYWWPSRHAAGIHARRNPRRQNHPGISDRYSRSHLCYSDHRLLVSDSAARITAGPVSGPLAVPVVRGGYQADDLFIVVPPPFILICQRLCNETGAENI